jgi:hypothetical protein
MEQFDYSTNKGCEPRADASLSTNNSLSYEESGRAHVCDHTTQCDAGFVVEAAAAVAVVVDEDEAGEDGVGASEPSVDMGGTV